MKSRITLLITLVASAITLSGTLEATQIGLRCKDTGKWLCAEGGGGSTLVANRSDMGPWETFSVTDLNGGRLQSGDLIGFQSDHGNYMCAEGGGGSNAVANRWGLGGWEKFRIIRKAGPGTIQSNDEVYIQHESGYYMCAENGGGGIVNVNRTSPGGWETFYATVIENPIGADSLHWDVNGDGIPDEIIKHGSYNFQMSLSEWTDCTNYWALDYNGYWKPWQIYYANGGNGDWYPNPDDPRLNKFHPAFSAVWDINEVDKLAYMSNECFVYFSKSMQFQADEGYDYVLYEDPSGSTDLNPATWVPVYTVSQWGNELRTVGLGTFDAAELDGRAYYLVKLGKPLGSFDLQFSSETDPSLYGTSSSIVIGGSTSSIISVGARDVDEGFRNLRGLLEWKVETFPDGVVLMDWTLASRVDFPYSTDDRSVVVTVRLGNQNPGFWKRLKILIFGDGRTRAVGSSYDGGCALGTMRSIIKLAGQSVPSEAQVVEWCRLAGKNPAEWDTVGIKEDEIIPLYNRVLGERGMGLVHCGGQFTKDQMRAKLQAGKILMVANIVTSRKESMGNREIGHHLCMKMRADGMVEILDPLEGKTHLRTVEEALGWAEWSDSGQTGMIYEVTP